MLHEVFPMHDLELDPSVSQCPISKISGKAEGVPDDQQGTSGLKRVL
jgi:hypothetical protein